MAVDQSQLLGVVPKALKSVGTLQPGVLWPGFDPASVPVAIFDGDYTILARFPTLPPGFASVSDDPSVGARPGRHPTVMANTATEIEGTLAAAILLDRTHPPSFDALMALVIHEAFHVFQRRSYPGWGANEVDLFVYPVEDPVNLALGRLEMMALQRALDAESVADVAMWAGAALTLREERTRGLPLTARAYEQETERYEGLARYVEWRLTPGDRATVIPDDGFAPDDTRRRCYATGLAFALLLDQLRPGWVDTLGSNPTDTFDGLLAPHVSGGKHLTAAEREAALTRAEADVHALHAERTALRERLLTLPGWRLEIVADPIQPLMPHGFDPMNCMVVRPDEVVHHRYLRLGNATDHVELFGMSALTIAAGAHPIFDGIVRLIIAGLSAEPCISEDGDMLRITGDGLTIETPSASIVRGRRLIRLHMRKPA